MKESFVLEVPVKIAHKRTINKKGWKCTNAKEAK